MCRFNVNSKPLFCCDAPLQSVNPRICVSLCFQLAESEEKAALMEPTVREEVAAEMREVLDQMEKNHRVRQYFDLKPLSPRTPSC